MPVGVLSEGDGPEEDNKLEPEPLRKGIASGLEGEEAFPSIRLPDPVNAKNVGSSSISVVSLVDCSTFFLGGGFPKPIGMSLGSEDFENCGSGST